MTDNEKDFKTALSALDDAFSEKESLKSWEYVAIAISSHLGTIRAALENAAVNQELLEVAKAVSNDWDELGKDFWGLPIPIRMSTINSAKQAIAKAEGKND